MLAIKTQLRMNRLFLYLVPFFLVAAGQLQAQDVWSLERCIEHARENSLTMKQASYTVEAASLTYQQNRLAALPNFNGSVSGGVQFGRTIDPTTNSFDNQTIGFNSYGISSGVTLYNGGRIQKSIRQSEIDLRASSLDNQATFNNLALNIASAYLQVLLGQEQRAAAERRLELTRGQLEQTDKLVEAGVLAEVDRYDLLSQLALSEQQLVQAKNGVELSLLSLKQLLEMDPGADFAIERPRVLIPQDADPDIYNLDAVYDVALGNQPQIEAGKLRLQSAELGIDIARTVGMPTLSLFANLNTNWSSLGRSVDGFETVFIPVQVMLPDGSSAVFELGQSSPIFVDQPYMNQLTRNFGQTVGLSLNVPIYNASRSSIARQQADLGVRNRQVTNDLQKQQLKSDVQRAIADARASKEAYLAAQRSFDAAELSLQNAERRFELGSINVLELNTSKTNYDTAEIELIRSKYQYLFGLKVVDFYLGRQLRLD